MGQSKHFAWSLLIYPMNLMAYQHPLVDQGYLKARDSLSGHKHAQTISGRSFPPQLLNFMFNYHLNPSVTWNTWYKMMWKITRILEENHLPFFFYKYIWFSSFPHVTVYQMVRFSCSSQSHVRWLKNRLEEYWFCLVAAWAGESPWELERPGKRWWKKHHTYINLDQ